MLNGDLNEHLYSVEEECEQRMEALIKQMKVGWGVTEQLMAENQMQWLA